MNGKTAKLLRKVANHRGKNNRQYRSKLKRMWYSLNRHERAEKRKELKAEIAN